MLLANRTLDPHTLLPFPIQLGVIEKSHSHVSPIEIALLKLRRLGGHDLPDTVFFHSTPALSKGSTKVE
jgi:hypothetical protein